MDEERQPLLSRRTPRRNSQSTAGTGGSLESLQSNSYTTGTATGRRRERSPRSKCKRRTACTCVLLSETFERIAFYGIVGNLVMFLNSEPYGWNFYNATNALFVFTGLSYTTSLLGGWIADSFLGKFKTVSIFFVIYLIGYVAFPLLVLPSDGKRPARWCASNYSDLNQSVNFQRYEVLTEDQLHAANWTGIWKYEFWKSVPPSTETCSWAIYLALAIVGIGNGAVKANISPFGADQIKHEGPAATRMFFNWFYWCINLGALISLGGLAYVQQERSFFWGYIGPNACVFVALIIFLCGSCVYVKKPPGGSILSNIIRILHQATRKSCSRKRSSPQGSENSSSVSPISSIETTPQWLDYAKIRYGGSYHDHMVEDVKILGKILCVFLALVPYWIVYFQMETTFVIQGLHMQLDFDNNGTKAAAQHRAFKIPMAWLSLFDVIFLVILIPFLDLVIYPFLDRRHRMPSVRVRILIGMLFAVLSVCAAGLVEMERLGRYWANNTEHTHWQIIANTEYRAASMTILYQIPQYALIGISEAFASVAGLELAYIQAPRSMQGIIMGLFWFTQGLGSIIGSALIYVFHGMWFFNWDHGDINCRNRPCPMANEPHRKCACHLDYYFFFLAGLQVLSVFVFILIAWKLEMGVNYVNRVRHRKNEAPKNSNRSGENEQRQVSDPRNAGTPVRTPASHVQQRPHNSLTTDTEHDTVDTDISDCNR